MPTPLATPPRQTSAGPVGRDANAKQRPATTQNTPARSPNAKLLKRASAEVDKQPGLYGTTNLRSRIQKWQELGDDPSAVQITEGTTRKNDSPLGRSNHSNEVLKNPKTSSGPAIVTPASKNKIPLESKDNKPSNSDGNIDEDVRAASAPPKRIVSDEHWKQDRASPLGPFKTTVPRKFEKLDKVISPSKTKPDAWVRRKSQGAKFGLVDTKPGLVSTQELRKDSPTRTPNAKVTRRDEKSKNIPAKASDHSSLDINGETTSDRYALLSQPDSPPPKASPVLLGPDSNDIKPAASSPQVSRRSTPANGDVRRMKSPPTNPKGSGNDSPVENRSPTPPKVFGTRIDAWLGSTPDPFTESPSRIAKYTTTPPTIRDSDSAIAPRTTPVRRSENRQSRSKDHSRIKDADLARAASPADERYLDNAGGDMRGEEVSPSALKRSGAHRRNASEIKPTLERSPSPRRSPSQRSFIDDAEEAFRPRIKDSRLQDTPSQKAQVTNSSRAPSSQQTSASKMLQLAEAPQSPQLESPDSQTDTQATKTKPKRPALNRATTSHADLLSVLSMPVARNMSIRSARSVRTNRVPIEGATSDDLMRELKTDEAKYLRELRTLVDGVVPVLLTCVLSRSNSVKAAGLFDPSKKSSNATGPIVNMGVALERLKSVHKRIPTSSPGALLMWAKAAHRVYADYLKAWRMGFKDVVVNLAPADENIAASTAEKATSGWDEGLERNNEGYVISGEGEKVDVAFLLKRPLVRLKYLARTFKGIHAIEGSHDAGTWATRYQELVSEARKRQNEERARLEDEAASSIDPTRARDPSSLAPLAGVEIDSGRCVRARDYFDLKLDHSTGQKVDCRIELILRDGKSQDDTGDLLICEVDSSSRWLFFPPIECCLVSSREGVSKQDIVVMIRGKNSDGQDWSELISLRANEDATASEWVQMLGLEPIPPPLNLTDPSKSGQLSLGSSSAPLTLANLGKLSPRDVEVPMGEQASVISQRWDGKPAGRGKDKNPMFPDHQRSSKSSRPVSMPSHIPKGQSPSSSAPATPVQSSHVYGSNLVDIPPNGQEDVASPLSSPESLVRTYKDYNVRLPSKDFGINSAEKPRQRHNTSAPDRPGMHWRTSSVPSADLPTVSKARSNQRPEQSPSGPRLPPTSMQKEPNKLQKPRPTQNNAEGRVSNEPARSLPQSPAQSPATPKLRNGTTPDFTPPSMGPFKPRRASSPLKHEYEPSESGESSVAGNIRSDDEMSVTSESSIDEDTIGPLPPPQALKMSALPRAPKSTYTQQSPGTMSPSESASQAPYRSVPQAPEEATQVKQIASIFSWSDKGMWQSLHPDECSIVVSPGLIEAFEMSAAHSHSKNAIPIRPLIALELTPLVPLRKGTAIDISIRSPPTANSKLKTGNNLMFRSRNNQECDVLYGMINQARINNPTYIALQNARGPGESNWGAMMDRRASSRQGPASSWWRFGSKKSSYRAGSTRRTPSIAMESESSVATMSSAISALKRFSANSKLFDVAKSTIMSRKGPSASRGHSSASINSSSSASGESDPVRIDPTQGTPAGITNTKIRLYERESASKWRDMGPALLTIMHPPRAPGGIVSATKLEKRIVVTGKTRGETLMDVTLGESAFERVARTGIAVSTWEHSEEVGKSGGVSTAKVRIFMIQMGSEAEAAFTFSLVGKLRY